MAKGSVCKTAIHRFNSDRRLHFFAQVVELVDTRDLKSLGLTSRAGSSPALGTTFVSNKLQKSDWTYSRSSRFFVSGFPDLPNL